MSKPCRNCGAYLPEGASFCPHCAQSQIERQEVKLPRLWRRKALAAAACVLVLAAAALAVFLTRCPETYEGGALTLSEPTYNRNYLPAARECDITYSGESGTNDLIWTLNMKMP